MRNKDIPELDKLFQEIGTYRKSEEFKELLDFIKKFPRLAPFDALLVHIQKPGSVYVASEAQWKQRFGRRVKTGARPLVILQPFGPVAFVFDLSDTEKGQTLVLHELGHLYCGHLGAPFEKWWPSRCFLGRNEGEFEAESVCWLICERMGIKNPSESYLSGYLNDNKEIPMISIDRVLKAAGIIESLIRGSKEPRKEIIVGEISDEYQQLTLL